MSISINDVNGFKWKSKTQVTSYELQVQIHELEDWKQELQDWEHKLGN